LNLIEAFYKINSTLSGLLKEPGFFPWVAPTVIDIEPLRGYIANTIRLKKTLSNETSLLIRIIKAKQFLNAKHLIEILCDLLSDDFSGYSVRNSS
jgi:hypothetical protein